jgi:release factor glutamine methyltransferase
VSDGPVATGRGTAVRNVLGDAGAALAAAGCDTPRLDAELLLASALGVSRSRLVVDREMALGDDAVLRFDALLTRRALREPVAYILGSREFRRITVGVDRRVLIPRPETELLVEVGSSLPSGARVVDVGTGSGAVALALKDERADLCVTGTDVSAGAVAVARENALRLGLDVAFMEADLLGGIACDAVLANLPYVAVGSSLAPEITEYEPVGALFAGDDGLDLIRRLVAVVGGVSMVALEVGFDQAVAVAGLVSDAGFGSVERLRDLAGHERVVVGRR